MEKGVISDVCDRIMNMSLRRSLHRVSIIMGLAVAVFLSVACEGEYPDKVQYGGGAAFRAMGDAIQINRGAGWHDIWIKAVNLAVAKPGKFPGELSLSRDDYDRWLKRVADMNCNVVRLYTLHHPVFYQALGEWNRDHPQQPIYLLQGIWLDEFEHGDYITNSTNQLDEEIRYVVDAVHGQADIPARFGKAYGKYRHDVSRWIMGWLPGHEMDGMLVDNSNRNWSQLTSYDGYYIDSPKGLPIEAWVARALDHVVFYELDKYEMQHPVGYSSWPTLDPMKHPFETDRFAQDLVNTNFGRFKTKGIFQAGLFVSYHVYPFYPEFIIYDPTYVGTVDSSGKKNNYLGYLLDLKNHHRGIPLLITEFGIPSSMGSAHLNRLSYNHGGYSEAWQSQAVVNLLADIHTSKAAGASVFELIDEWFKGSWMNKPTTIPSDRGRFWFDLNDPEESFGLIAHYPIVGLSKTIDGKSDDWTLPAERLVTQSGTPVSPAGDGKDYARTLRGLSTSADPAFFTIKLDIGTTGLADLDDTVYYIGISTIGGRTGDQLYPDNLGVSMTSTQGLEFVVKLDAKDKKFEVLADAEYEPTARMNGKSKTGGTPSPNNNGTFSSMKILINNNEQYKLSGKGFVPPLEYFSPGELRRGNSTTDTKCNYQLGTNGVIELRIPWQTLWVTDPSSRQVLFDNVLTNTFDATETSGFTVTVVSAARDSAGKLKVVDVMPRSAYKSGAFATGGLPFYTWKKWDTINTTERLKPSYYMMQNAYRKIQ